MDRSVITLFMLMSVDGNTSTGSAGELSGIAALELIGCSVLKDSYIRLRYKVLV